MSLRRITLISIFSIFLLLAVVLSLSLQTFLSRHFRFEEVQQNNLNMQRALVAFEQNYQVLEHLSNDWGEWDEMYDFVIDPDPAFIEDNMESGTFIDLEVNLIFILNNEGELLDGRAYDLMADTFINLPAGIADYIVKENGFADYKDDLDTDHGLIFIDEKAILIAVSPILQSDGEGEVRGSIVFGSFFTDTMKAQMEKTIQLPVKTALYDAAELDADFAVAKAHFINTEEEFYSQAVTQSNMAGYFLLRDVKDRPVLILRVDQPRFSAMSTEVMLIYLAIGLTFASFVFAGFMFIIVDRVILSRVFRLSGEVQDIAKEPEKISLVTVDKRDELTALSTNINLMLDALSNAHDERKLMEEQLRGVVESINDVVFTVDSNFSQLRFYGRAVEKYGPFPQEIKLEDIFDLFPDDLLEDHIGPVRKAYNGENVMYEWPLEWGGETLHFQISLAPLHDVRDGSIGLVGVAREITNLKTMEIQLRTQYEELTVLYNTSQLFLKEESSQLVKDELCRLAVEHFDVAYAILGEIDPFTKAIQPLASNNLPLKRIDAITLNGNVNQSLELLGQKEEVVLESISLKTEKLHIEACPYLLLLPLAVADSPLMVLCLCSRDEPRLSDERRQFLRSFGNLAEIALEKTILFEAVQQNQLRLQDLSQRLVQVHEEERRWLARELHDEIGQYLTALKLSVSIDSHPNNLGEKQIQMAQKLVDELIHKVRQMSLDLRPSILDDLGLLPALNWFLERYTQQTDIQVQFAHLNLARRRFAPNLEITVFRVVQEALTNVARYADVAEVHVDVSVLEDELSIIISDEGKGFDPDVLGNKQSSGITGIQERVRLLNGEMQLDAASGEGTTINVKLPIDEEMTDDN